MYVLDMGHLVMRRFRSYSFSVNIKPTVPLKLVVGVFYCVYP